MVDRKIMHHKEKFCYLWITCSHIDEYKMEIQGLLKQSLEDKYFSKIDNQNIEINCHDRWNNNNNNNNNNCLFVLIYKIVFTHVPKRKKN
jgi:hypothetical protein